MSDQIATIADRVDCSRELSETVPTSTGIVITDQARFFSGDKPAQYFERGTQQGGNLYDLSAHTGQQSEVVCLHSVNIESRKIFGQAKKIALNTTNRQAEHVIPEIMLRLQMKQRERSLLISISNKHTKVQVAAKGVPRYTGSTFSKSFLHSRCSTWQAHLERISSYLVHGPEVWRTYDNLTKPTCFMMLLTTQTTAQKVQNWAIFDQWE